MWGISPHRIFLLQTVRIMNDACRISQSVSHGPRNKCVPVFLYLHASCVCASSVAPSVFCWAYNKCQLIKILTACYRNLSSIDVPEIWHSALHLCEFQAVKRRRECGRLFSPGIDPTGSAGESRKIPSATSVRLGWVKKESSLWLLSLWITPQYGITLQWMSADTKAAAQLWTIQQRFGYRAATEYLLI